MLRLIDTFDRVAVLAHRVGRRARADRRTVPSCTAADLTASVDRLPPEPPGLVGALAMRGAVFGPHAG